MASLAERPVILNRDVETADDRDSPADHSFDEKKFPRVLTGVSVRDGDLRHEQVSATNLYARTMYSKLSKAILRLASGGFDTASEYVRFCLRYTAH